MLAGEVWDDSKALTSHSNLITRGNTQHYFWLHCRDFQSFLHIFRCASISWIHNLARLTEINFFSVTQKPILFQIIHESNNDSGTNCQSKTNNTSDSRNACNTSFASDTGNVRFARNARNASKVRRALSASNAMQAEQVMQAILLCYLCESIFELFVVELRPAHFESDLPTIRREVV